jgi:hypothetical protein
MNLNSRIAQAEAPPTRWRGVEGVALVITLLLLSVITFLAIAFLAMSRQNKAAVSASLDVATARAAADAALARAQAEISAAMLAHGDALYYDYMVSRNYVSPAYTNGEKYFDPNNVNYDFLANTTTRFSSANNPTGWAQNIANLWYDPRPPVFVVTNPAYPTNYDFRFYVDLNRNGEFETNGDQPTIILTNGVNIVGPNAVMNGEPEWIGQLRNPLYHHSGTNAFINRYAYLVLPIGKTLDLNYMGNFLKKTYMNGFSALQPGESTLFPYDGYARDQGIGSWELNLAGLLEAVSPWAYEEPASFSYPGYPTPSFGPYSYSPPDASSSGFNPNRGNAFEDAQAIIAFRYGSPIDAPFSLKTYFPTNYLDFVNNNIDAYCADAQVTSPFDYNHTNVQQPVTQPWAGSYSTNMIYDPQDLFDATKVSGFLPARLLVASQRTNTFDRYTFLRLLSSAGIGSSPEYGVWVYGDSTNIVPPLVLRTKINLNYDNTAQITNVNAPYAPAPTFLEPWNPTTFFNNAAELLLRSKIFTFSNMVGTNLLGTTFTQTFGVTNIPIFRTNNPGVCYDEGIHRMLQVAANIYDATQPTPTSLSGSTVRHPTIFRPRFGFVGSGTNLGINIIGYVQVTNATLAYKQILSHNGFKDLSIAAQDSPATLLDDNIWGIPWIVSAEKGLPQFNQYSYNSRVLFTRKLLFVRQGTAASYKTNLPPQYTNQFYCMAISNSLGMDAWNAYPSNFTGSAGYTSCYISNYITIQVTNNYNYGFTTSLINYKNNPAQHFTWSPNLTTTGQSRGTNANGFISFFPTNIISLQSCYFSEANRNLVFFTNGIISSNGFLLADMKQTGWPVHNWTLNITNHLVYVLFDGSITDGSVLDFVNLGPFGTSLSLNPAGSSAGGENAGLGNGPPTDEGYWLPGNAIDLPNSPMSAGMLTQIKNGETNTPYYNALLGSSNSSISSWTFGAPYDPANSSDQLSTWVANDPLVHYTVDDLYWPGHTPLQPTPAIINSLVTNNLGTVSARYSPWGAQDIVGNNMLFKDPLMYSSTNWAFPTNKFPGVGWIGRVHRGTPWQTIYLKSDSPESLTSQNLWTSAWVKSPETYPTNDWSMVDVFTTAPNDNAARGLLAVNQTNDAAWAAVFAGVIAPVTATNGTQILPLDVGPYLMDSQYGINNQRTNHPNGIFHKVGDILAASALTTNSPYLLGNPANYSDEIIERIPQQTLSLLKVGEPQFVIFAWGQSLKPKGAPYLVSGPNFGMYTNYEITGECLTRTVCHFVHTNGLKMVVDSYNVESANP